MRQPYLNAKAIILGFAIFSMFFGAGNVIYPIDLGVNTGLNLSTWVAFMITAIGAPLLGLYALVLAQGDLNRLFSPLGKVGALLATALLILALGPMGAMPRCVLLSHQAFNGSLFDIPLPVFSVLLGALLFVIALKPLKALTLLGQWLSPLLLGLLFIVTLMSLLGQTSMVSQPGHFMDGLVQGYQTMDLLAALLFGATIWRVVSHFEQQNAMREQVTLVASGIGALLLGFVYFGLAFAASFHAQELETVTGDVYLRKMSYLALGDIGSRVACLILFLACFTTLIALMMTCVDHIMKSMKGKARITASTVIAVILVFTMVTANLGFERLSQVIGWLVSWTYPFYILMVLIFIARQKLPWFKRGLI